MDWSKIANVVGNAAPFIGTLLGGPAGGAVGALVANALGTANDPDSVVRALNADPAAFAKLQELQLNAKVELQKLALAAEQNRLAASSADFAAEVADRDSARKLAAAQPNDFVRPAITFGVLTGALMILVIVFSGWGQTVLSNPTASLTVGSVIGYWFAVLNNCMSFWFGSTKDGAQQSKDLTKFATAPAAAIVQETK